MNRIAFALVAFVTTAAWGEVAKVPPPKQPPISAAAAALVPDAGWLVATHTDSELIITRITKTGPKEVSRLKSSSAHTTWLDAHTLVHVTVDYDKNIEVSYLVDGVVDPKRTVKHKGAVWSLKDPEKTINPTALRGPDGAIWLERCISEQMPDCTKSTWLRVDSVVTKPARTKPPKLTSFTEALKAPTVKAPAGYTGKIVKVKSKSGHGKVTAIECTGPSGKLVWSEESPPIDPAEHFTPEKTRWIHSTPPLFEVSGELVNPVGQRDTTTYVFRECGAAPIEIFSWIGEHAWSYETRDSDHITVLVDDMPVALLFSTGLIAAPK